MALNLNALADQSATVYVSFMGQTARIKYNPAFITHQTLEWGDDKYFDFFMGLVREWDVTEGDTTVPLTPAGLGRVPMVFLRAVTNRVIREQPGQSPEGDEPGKDSSAGSPQTETKASAPTGISGSEQPST